MEYELSDETKNTINDDITEKFEMSLDEFTELDCDVQIQLIEEYHGHKMGVDNSLFISGGVYNDLVTLEELDRKLQEMDKVLLEEKPRTLKK